MVRGGPGRTTSPEDFTSLLEIYSGTCSSLNLVAQGQGGNCLPVTVCACLPAPAVYLVKIHPVVGAVLQAETRKTSAITEATFIDEPSRLGDRLQAYGIMPRDSRRR